MLSLHGLRKPAWMAHQLLNRLGSERVAVTGGSAFRGAFATRAQAGAAALVYADPGARDAGTSRLTVRVAWPFGRPTLTRLGAEENNVIAAWRGMGAPPYPTLEQLSRLRETNTLKAAPADAVSLEGNAAAPVAVFDLECPGVALLEVR